MERFVGRRGHLNEQEFEVIECVRRESEREIAFDAILIFDRDAREGRIVECHPELENVPPQFVVLVDVGPVSPPGFDTLKIGQRVAIGEDSFEISEIQRFFISMHGPGRSITWVWLTSKHKPDELALVEYATDQVSFFRGKLFDADSLARIFI